MKRIIRPLKFTTISLLLTGCVYSKVRLPLDKDVSETTLGPKVGRASITSVAWLFSWGDAGTHAAAQAGGIRRIDHLDSEYMVVLFGLYSERTTIAYGE